MSGKRYVCQTCSNRQDGPFKIGLCDTCRADPEMIDFAFRGIAARARIFQTLAWHAMGLLRDDPRAKFIRDHFDESMLCMGRFDHIAGDLLKGAADRISASLAKLEAEMAEAKRGEK